MDCLNFEVAIKKLIPKKGIKLVNLLACVQKIINPSYPLKQLSNFVAYNSNFYLRGKQVFLKEHEKPKKRAGKRHFVNKSF